VCGTEWPEPQQELPAIETAPAPPLPQFFRPEALSDAFAFIEGFHRADWKQVRAWIETNVIAIDSVEAWNEAASYWVGLLRQDLGGDYQVWSSRNALLLTDLPPKAARWLLDYIGEAVSTIESQLRHVAWAGSSGKLVVLVFGEVDDYYQYLAYHLKERVQPATGGVCIHSGYTHIAIPWDGEANTAGIAVHELTHYCLAHLPLPVWLNEGLAVKLQTAIGPPPEYVGQSTQARVWSSAIQWRRPVMWHELAERHFAFWNEQNIQRFWAGVSFHEPGMANELSYSLAEVFVTLLTERGQGLLQFVERADRRDAGQSAALEVLGVDLGDMGATFLGQGNWRPRRKAIADLLEGGGVVRPHLIRQE